MNLYWSQSKGQMTDDDGHAIATGWAGNNKNPKWNPRKTPGKNCTAYEDMHNIGPLPRGLYKVGQWGPHPELGELSATLTQIDGETFGRDSFYIHGPDKDPEFYGEESRGCIVLPHDQRLKVAALNPTMVKVTA